MHKIHIFLFWIGIIKAQITGAFIIFCNAKVQGNGLGMANMQITIRLRWKTSLIKILSTRIIISDIKKASHPLASFSVIRDEYIDYPLSYRAISCPHQQVLC